MADELFDLNDDDVYVVENILAHRRSNQNPSQYEYRIKWEGYNDLDDLTWEPESNISADVVLAYKSAVRRSIGRPQLLDSAKKIKLDLSAQRENYSVEKGKLDSVKKEQKSTWKKPEHSRFRDPKLQVTTRLEEGPLKPVGANSLQMRECDLFDINTPEQILGITSRSGELFFLLKLKEDEDGGHFVSSKVAYRRIPALVIQFFETYIKFED